MAGGGIQYAGSLLKYSFAEADHAKSVNLVELDAEMRSAAEQLDFERAIALRERIRQLEQKGGSESAPAPRKARAKKTAR